MHAVHDSGERLDCARPLIGRVSRCHAAAHLVESKLAEGEQPGDDLVSGGMDAGPSLRRAAEGINRVDVQGATERAPRTSFIGPESEIADVP